MATESFTGPVSLLVFNFPEGAVVDAGLSALLAAVDARSVDILDLEVIGKDATGQAQRLDWSLMLSDASRSTFAGAESDVLDADDLTQIAAALPDGHFAVAVVYEDRSLAAAASAWSDAGAVELFVGGVDLVEADRLLNTEGAI